MKTELVFILDASGSMYPLASDTVGGFRAMLEERKAKPDADNVLVTTVLFNSGVYLLHDRIPLLRLDGMTENDYRPSGCTALADAIGSTVQHVENIHRYARPEDVPDKTIFVITTDGMENASKFFTADDVRKAVKTKREKDGWEFLFLGADLDAVETAEYYGIDRSRAARYVNDSSGTAKKFRAAAMAVDAMMSSVPLEKTLWKSVLEEKS